MIYCTHCGKEVKDAFCTWCGTRAVRPEEAQPAVEVVDSTEPALEGTQEPVAAVPESEQTDTADAGKAEVQPDAAELVMTEPERKDAAEPVVTEPERKDAADAGEAAKPQGALPSMDTVDKPGLWLEQKGETSHVAPPRTYTFLNTGVGLVYAAMLVAAVVVMGRYTAGFFETANLYSVGVQLALFGMLGLAAVLSVRAKGLDLSIGPVAALSAAIVTQTIAFGGSTTMGVLLALSAALIVGLINGLMAVQLKIGAIIVTLVTGAVVAGANTALLQNQMVAARLPDILTRYVGTAPIGALILLGVVFLFAGLLVLLSKLGEPQFKRKEGKPAISYLLAYIGSSLIAALAGVVLLSSQRAASPELGTGYEIYLLFVFALMSASRGVDNRFAPAFYALVPAFVWAVLTNVMALWYVIPYYQPMIYGGLALVSLAVTYMCRLQRKAGKLPLRGFKTTVPADGETGISG